ncbi:MAG: (2Fe-2S) ferredoxin domain-containing protein [Xenococcaceae cyanobacterium MO_188.B29]|nr:(2Fe-2S) ferredoxin domain-containing protein [Xenococcaceae cyanobacterium MO_188.B29]
MNQQSNQAKKVLICQGRSCRKYGAERVLIAFRVNLVPGVEITPCGCLGQCGNGPMVLVEPEQIWYSEVLPDEVSLIVKQHLKQQRPVKEILYPKFHSDCTE